MQVGTYPTRNFALTFFRSIRLDRRSRRHSSKRRSLHVAMQLGPSHDPVSWTSGVWPLRILTRSGRAFLRFMVCAIVVPAVRVDATRAAKEVPKIFPAAPAARALRHHELSDLIAEL